MYPNGPVPGQSAQVPSQFGQGQSVSSSGFAQPSYGQSPQFGSSQVQGGFVPGQSAQVPSQFGQGQSVSSSGFSQPSYGQPSQQGQHLSYSSYGMNRYATHTAPPVQQASRTQAAPVYSVPTAKKRISAFEIVILIISTLAFLTMIGIIAFLGGGALGTPLMLILALPSMLIVLATFHFIDRWEIEPLWTRLVSLAWGAGVATLGALFVNEYGAAMAYFLTGDEVLTDFVTGVIVAPLSEESLKGLVILVLVLVRRHHFQSYLDGVLHAGLVGAGFAFTENILYFVTAGEEAGAQGVIYILFLRGFMSPFVHPMATSMTGLALGWAVTRMRSRYAWMWMGPLGWFMAVSIHGLWNLMASLFDPASWFIGYAIVQVPLFVGWMTALLLASNREAKHIAAGLTPYVNTGWLLPAEVVMATNGPSRRGALRWAARGGSHSRRAMADFLNIACGLGLDQLVMARIGPDPKRIVANRESLGELVRARQTYLQATGTRLSSNGMVVR